MIIGKQLYESYKVMCSKNKKPLCKSLEEYKKMNMRWWNKLREIIMIRILCR